MRAGLRVVAGLGVVVLASGCFRETGYEREEDDGEETSFGSSDDASDEAPSTADDASSDASTSDGTDDSIGSSDGDTSTTAADGTDGSSGTDDSSSGTDSTTGDVVLDVEALGPGDLVITEVMWNPFCYLDLCEWIEVLNTTSERVSLVDLRVFDSGASDLMQGRITAELIVEPGARIVLARSTTEWPYDVQPDGVYGPNPSINNTDVDSISLRNGSGIIDQTPLMPFESPQGLAWQLRPEFLDAEANDEPEHWCDSASPLPAGDFDEFGTPGSDAVQCVELEPPR